MNIAELSQSLEQNITFTFARSGGPGGQNVNKVNTKVLAHVPFILIKGLTEMEQIRTRQKLASRINNDGDLFIAVQDERSQERNRAIAVARLIALVSSAAILPKKRKKTKPTAASKERRLASKKLRSSIKALRQQTGF